MKNIYEVQNYYSGWHTDSFFSSGKKAQAYVLAQLEIYKKKKEPGRMDFRILVRKVQ